MKLPNSLLIISILLMSVPTSYGMDLVAKEASVVVKTITNTSPRKKPLPKTPFTSPKKSQDQRGKSPRFMTKVRQKLDFEAKSNFTFPSINASQEQLSIYEQDYTEGTETYSLFDNSSSEEEPSPAAHQFSVSFDYLITQMDSAQEMAHILNSQQDKKAQEIAEAIKGGRRYAEKIKSQQLAKLNTVPHTNKSHSNSPEKISKPSYSNSSKSSDNSNDSFFN